MRRSSHVKIYVSQHRGGHPAKLTPAAASTRWIGQNRADAGRAINPMPSGTAGAVATRKLGLVIPEYGPILILVAGLRVSAAGDA
jgi:hypothetical protein